MHNSVHAHMYMTYMYCQDKADTSGDMKGATLMGHEIFFFLMPVAARLVALLRSPEIDGEWTTIKWCTIK